MNVELIKTLSHEMRLHGIHSAAESRAAQAVAESLHPLEFLRLLLEDEKLQRKNRTAKALATRAKFRSEASIEDWDHTFDRGVSKAKLKELIHLSFLNKNENLILEGPTGTGKTHLSISLGKRLCNETTQTLFFSTNLLFEEIMAEKASGKYLKFLKKITKIPVIILDDFGLRNYTHEEATVLMDLIEEKYRKGSIIITTQVSPKGWKKLFEDPVIGEAITDRLINPSQKIILKGGSYRERISK